MLFANWAAKTVALRATTEKSVATRIVFIFLSYTRKGNKNRAGKTNLAQDWSLLQKNEKELMDSTGTMVEPTCFAAPGPMQFLKAWNMISRLISLT